MQDRGERIDQELRREAVSERSLLSAEVFTIPIDEKRFVVYAPLRRAAFVTNATGVNRIADLVEVPPADLVSGVPMPTSVTLFLTTACNLRCRYCYASAGDTRYPQ